MKRDDDPDTTNRREVSACIRRRIMLRRVDNFCELCGTHCHILAPEQVAADIVKLRAIVDYLLREDPNAGIHIRRGRDHEFMLHVECDDADIAKGLSVSRECNQGIWFRAEVRTRDTHDDPDVALLRALHSFGERRLGTGGPDPTWWCAADIAAALAEPVGGSALFDGVAELRGAIEHARERRRIRSYGAPKQQAVTALITPLVGAKRGGYLLCARGTPKRGRIYHVEAIDPDGHRSSGEHGA